MEINTYGYRPDPRKILSEGGPHFIYNHNMNFQGHNQGSLRKGVQPQPLAQSVQYPRLSFKVTP